MGSAADTFENLYLKTGLILQQTGIGTNDVLASPASVTSYSLILPTAQGAANTAFLNDGSGNLSWSQAIATTSTPTFAALTLTAALTVPNGGTGDQSFTAYSVLTGGTTSTGALQNVSGVGTAGQALTSNGAGALPTWQNVSGSGTVNSGTAGQLAYYATSTNAVNGSSVTVSGSTITASLTGHASLDLPLTGGTLSGTLTMSSSTIAMGSNKITGLAAASTSGDALSWGNALNGTTLTLTGQETVADGSVSAPSYSFTNATNSGMRHAVFPAVSVAAANWNTTTHKVTATGFGIPGGVIGQLTTTGTLPSGLSLATNYWLDWWDANTFSLASSYINYLDFIPAAFTTQGTGVHTFTPNSTPDVGISVGGVDAIRSSLENGAATPTLWVGNVDSNAGTQYSELIHAEGDYHGGGGVPSAVDIILVNSGGYDSRMIVQSLPPSTITPNTAYLIAHGLNSTAGNYWGAGSPSKVNSCELALGGLTSNAITTVPGGGAGTYFVNQNDLATWEWVGMADPNEIILAKIKTGGCSFLGTTTNDNAATGNVGNIFFKRNCRYYQFYYFYYYCLP